jgi:hypothetical protein
VEDRDDHQRDRDEHCEHCSAQVSVLPAGDAGEGEQLLSVTDRRHPGIGRHSGQQ